MVVSLPFHVPITTPRKGDLLAKFQYHTYLGKMVLIDTECQAMEQLRQQRSSHAFY